MLTLQPALYYNWTMSVKSLYLLSLAIFLCRGIFQQIVLEICLVPDFSGMMLELPIRFYINCLKKILLV